MFNQRDEDDNTRVGLWITFGAAFLVVAAVVGTVVVRHLNKGAPAAAAPAVEALLEGPISGDLVGKLYFGLGEATLPADAAGALGEVVKAMAAAPARTLVLSGFHDTSGDPAKNAELAKQRALGVREALKAAGADAAKVKLRKPESTTGDGTAQEARRVEMRLVD